MAVLALAVLGTAGTFAYRAMFGGSALPAASAVTKTGNWPNKIVSNYGDDRRSDSNQTPMASADPSEELVSREEKPLDIQGPKNGTARHFHNSDFSKLERPFARRPRICGGCPIRASACARCCPSGAYGRICPAGGSNWGTGFAGAEEDPHRRNPLRLAGLRRGRPCDADGSICLAAGTSCGTGTGFS